MQINKYRLWDKKRDVMWQPIELTKLIGYMLYQSCPNAETYLELKDHLDKMVWLESTGLFDKKGNEIFEGDIITCATEHRPDQFRKRPSGLSYDPVSSWDLLPVEVKRGEGYWIPFIGYDVAGLYSIDLIGCEVIGNIYQNPELLG